MTAADHEDDRIEGGIDAARRSAQRVLHHERGASSAPTEIQDDASPVLSRRALADVARAADLSAEATLRIHYRVISGRRLALLAVGIAVGAMGWAASAALLATYVAWQVLW